MWERQIVNVNPQESTNLRAVEHTTHAQHIVLSGKGKERREKLQLKNVLPELRSQTDPSRQEVSAQQDKKSSPVNKKPSLPALKPSTKT